MSLERTQGVCFPTRERDRIEMRKAQQEEQEAERKREEAKMQPVRQAETELNKTAVALREVEKAAVLAGKADPAGFELPESLCGKKMSLDAAIAFNRDEARKFVISNPAYYPSPANFKTITDYLAQHQIQIANEETFYRAYERLKFLGLLVERPDEAQPGAEPQPETIVEQIDPEAERQQRYERYMTDIVVTDPRTGEGLTEYQLDRVPADEYARLMRVPRFVGILEPPRAY